MTVHAHSWSEVAAGLTLGGAVGMVSLMRGSLTDFRVRLWVPLATAAWLLVMPMHAPASKTHALVTKMALALSGRPNPYTCQELRRHGQASPKKHRADASGRALVSPGTLTATWRLPPPH